MNNEKKISVIIPVFNTEKFLERCIDSITENTYNNLEIICVNDGSTDGSQAVLEGLQQKDSRIKIINVPNGGVSRARNIGIDNAGGEYISFIDSDDLVHRKYFATLMYYHERYDVDEVVCNFSREVVDCKQEVDVANLRYKYVKGNQILDDSQLKSYSTGRVYTRECIGAHRFPENIKIAEDKVFNMFLLANGCIRKAIHIDCSLYYYIFREDSALQSITAFDSLKLGKFCLELIENGLKKESLAVVLNEAFVSSFTGRYGVMFIRNKRLQEDVKRQIRKCLTYEKQNKPFCWKRSLVVRMIAYFPIIYRAYRIAMDKTMIAWEKKAKQNRVLENYEGY